MPGRELHVVGIVNVTPDSFSDGGLLGDVEAAVVHARHLMAEGAALLDVGGESTRPGARPVAAREELQRVMPVIGRLCAMGLPVSVDTTKVEVAAAALAAGACQINDISAFRGAPELAGLVADHGARCCLMHMQGHPGTMQRAPRYADVVCEVKAFLEERLAFAVGEGVDEAQVVLDPGIGFGKSTAHNLALLARLDEIVAIGRPVMIGTSRKSFLGEITGRPVGGRLAGTVASNLMAFDGGASLFRVHDVAAMCDALAVARAVAGASVLSTARGDRG
jgi:dihydropteroate synthase